MKKSLVIFLVLLITQASYANTCQYEFIRHYNEKEFKSLRELNNKTFNTLKKQIKAEEDPRKKLALIEEQYELISSLFEARKEYLTILANAQKIPKEKLQELVHEAYAELVASYRFEINFITNESQKILKETGFNTKTKFRKVNGKTQVKYLEFDIENSTANSAKLLRRYMDKMGTRRVTFDFYQNMDNGSAGFSIATQKRIDLGIRGIRNIALDGIITMVGKHEFKHGGFARMRVLGIDSIYHADYTSISGRPLSSANSGYSSYMSAEELYNFVNNPFWASKRIANVANYEFLDAVNDIAGINYYLKKTTEIAKQTSELSDFFIGLLKSDITDLTKVRFDISKMDRNPTMLIDDAHYVVVTDVENGRVLHAYINDAMKADVEEIIKVKEQLFAKYQKEFMALNAQQGSPESVEAAQALIKKFQADEIQMAQANYEKIAENIVENQTVLNAVATRIVPLNQELVDETEALVTVLRKNLADPELTNRPGIEETFKNYAQKYRELGRLVRERYKGFIAKDIKDSLK